MNDDELLRAAVAKKREGKSLSRAEAAALRRHLKEREESDRRKYYQTVPKRHYCEMSGRQHKVLLEQAARYGIPLRGDTLDLYAIIRWVHDFLAEHGPQILRLAGEEEELLGGDSTPALENLRHEKYLLARLERMERMGQLLRRSLVHDGLAKMATRLRACGEALQKKYDPDAQALLDEALDDVDREIAALFAGDDETEWLEGEPPEGGG